MPHPNEELFRAGYDVFARGDMDALRDKYFTEDIVLHAAGSNQISGDFEGVDAAVDNFGRTFELSGGTFRAEVHFWA